jgi:hypothetical protein
MYGESGYSRSEAPLDIVLQIAVSEMASMAFEVLL